MSKLYQQNKTRIAQHHDSSQHCENYEHSFCWSIFLPPIHWYTRDRRPLPVFLFKWTVFGRGGGGGPLFAWNFKTIVGQRFLALAQLGECENNIRFWINWLSTKKSSHSLKYFRCSNFCFFETYFAGHKKISSVKWDQLGTIAATMTVFRHCWQARKVVLLIVALCLRQKRHKTAGVCSICLRVFPLKFQWKKNVAERVVSLSKPNFCTIR